MTNLVDVFMPAKLCVDSVLKKGNPDPVSLNRQPVQTRFIVSPAAKNTLRVSTYLCFTAKTKPQNGVKKDIGTPPSSADIAHYLAETRFVFLASTFL
jgi:hypothetical protein